MSIDGRVFFVGDEVVTLLVDYAVALANRGHSDPVAVSLVDVDGVHVNATCSVGVGVPLIFISSTTAIAEPGNCDAVHYLRDRLERLRNRHVPASDGLEEFRSC